MRKKIVCTILISAFLLTGCKKSSEMFLSYSDNVNDQTDFLVRSDELIRQDLFSEDLCVIPLKSDKDQDGNLSASANLIVNVTNKKVVYADNVYERLYPASITKIATALVTLKYGNLSDTVTFSKNASNITESGAKLCGFKEGDKVNLSELLTALLIYSGNDAGIAIAEHVAGSEEAFSDMMNEELKSLGAVDSHFVNAHGLHDDNHYTTAYDLYLIFNELLKYDEFIKMINTTSIDVTYTDAKKETHSKLFENTNRYLKGTEKAPEGMTVIGGKTGTTFKAGSCLILYSKGKKNQDYISVILKSDSGDTLFSQMTYLLKMTNK